MYKGRWNGVLVAVKALSMEDGMAEEIEREAALLEQLRHPHILKFLGLFSNEDNQALFLPNKNPKLKQSHRDACLIRQQHLIVV